MTSKNSKELKIQSKHRELTYSYKTVPWLSLSGVWLEELGFKIGDTVKVITREKLLIIELGENQSPAVPKKENPIRKKQIR